MSKWNKTTEKTPKAGTLVLGAWRYDERSPWHYSTTLYGELGEWLNGEQSEDDFREYATPEFWQHIVPPL